MSDADLGQTEATAPAGNDALGSSPITQAPEEIKSERSEGASPSDAKATSSSQKSERAATIEHLAARRPAPELDDETPEIKLQLSELRTQITRLLTGLRWENVSVAETARLLMPLLNVGPVQQWRDTLIPFLLEVDRAGDLIPVWVNIIEQEDPADLPPDANPAETPGGRARRFALLLLGSYKSAGPSDRTTIGFKGGSSAAIAIDIVKELGKLATRSNSSLYATQSLVKQSTIYAMQTLADALNEAQGWARVDVVEGLLALNQPDFYDLVVASGLEQAPGLESYIAVPVYRIVPLEKYLSDTSNPFLTAQAALIIHQILLDSMNPPAAGSKTLPIIFERDLPTIASALFAGASASPSWQQAIAVHRLGTFMGRYWGEISRSVIQEPQIVNSIGACLPMMPDIERWIDGSGRDVLLATLNDADKSEAELTPVIKALGELREPRTLNIYLTRLEVTMQLSGRPQALALAAICDTLGRTGNPRAITVMQQLASRILNPERRSQQPRRRDNLPAGDADIPGSIVYAAIVRACGQSGNTAALPTIQQAIGDFDPFVRTQALEALKRLDPTGSAAQSRAVVRSTLADPRDSIVKAACQIVSQYRDVEAEPALRLLIEKRPELSSAAYEVLHQLGL